MPLFLLVRHGENEYVKKRRLAGRLSGVHLNKKGREQAQALAERLRGVPVKAVYSSPLERTMETATPIAQELKLEIIERPGLIEANYGEWQDQSFKSLRRLKLWKIVQNTPSIMQFPGGESFAQTQMRITTELVELSRLHDQKDLLVCVSHADPIKLAVAYFIGMPIDMFQRISVSPGSITALHLGESGGHLLALNVESSFEFLKS
jgi:probable phosphoglycerate mutase